MKQKNLYAEIFKTKEADVKTFADLVKAKRAEPQKMISKTAYDEISSDKPVGASVPQFLNQESGNILINHGWHSEDYVWHISPRQPKSWKVSTDRVIFAIAQTLNTVIPQTVNVNIYPPYAEWDIKDYTAKAFALRGVWNIPPGGLTKVTARLFEVLNALI